MSALPTTVLEDEMQRPAPARSSTRDYAVDAYRGFVMLLMLAEVLAFPRVARDLPSSLAVRVLAFNQTHVAWAGASLHDLIQPSFVFLVGMSLVYSVRSRQRRGQSFSHMLLHALFRSVLLVALGVGIHLRGGITLLDTLSQIGLCYTFAFLASYGSSRSQWIALFTILFFYWFAWAAYPTPPSPVVLPGWQETPFTGFEAHWNKGSNLGLAFDRWLLNALPHKQEFRFSDGGYVTLNFIPTLGTMILGLIAGRWSLVTEPKDLSRRLVLVSALLIALALLLHFTGLNPIVKRIWTPAWVFLSGGACLLMLAGFKWLASRISEQWLFPLIVIGMNSLVAYMLVPLWGHFVNAPLERHGGPVFFSMFGAFQPTAYGIVVLGFFWVILYLLHRRRIFIRI